MQLRLRRSLFGCLASAGMMLALAPASAAEPPPSGPTVQPAPAPAPTSSHAWSEELSSCACCDSCAPGARFYASGEYLLWWVKGAPLPVPLLSTGPDNGSDGALDDPAAQVLYGGTGDQDFAAFSGGRVNVGSWLDDEQGFGIEGGGFLLERQSAGAQARGVAGNPLLAIPMFNSQGYDREPTPRESALPFSLPMHSSGGVSISNSLRLWGADVTGVIGLSRGCGWELSFLTGFRYLDLLESLDLQGDLTGIGPFAGMSGQVRDRFQTRNQFYGGTLGVRGRYFTGPLSLDMTARVALGSSHEVQNVSGSYNAVNFVAPSGPIGVFAHPSNSGRRKDDDFAVVPELQLKVGYALTSRLRVTAGYDFLYYSSVVRPGDQINRSLPMGQTFQQGGLQIDPNDPVPLFNKSDFFAHGLNFGLELTY